jgi:hypothetical protein
MMDTSTCTYIYNVFILFYFLEMVSCYVTQASLELMILLLQPPDYLGLEV